MIDFDEDVIKAEYFTHRAHKLAAALVLSLGLAGAETRVGIRGPQFTINGNITYSKEAGFPKADPLIDRNLPLQRFATLEQSLAAGLSRRRFSTLLLTLFAALAMTLAAIGIYGLLNYWVTSRESEIAIRLSLGTRPSAILRWTSFHALRLAVIGMALGGFGAWSAARVMEDLVFGISPRNPATMIAAAVAVIVIAFAGAVLPAWRAAQIDPARRLHYA